VNPVLIALDVSDLERAERLARRLAPHVGGFKVGLELLMSEGPEAVARLADLGLPVFADAKLHDIPNTAAAAARVVARHGARWVTAHAYGGHAMLEAVAEALGEGAGLLAVTVLTSIASDDLPALGVEGAVESQVATLAALAAASGAEGVVCSVAEVGVVKKVSPDLLAVTPGIRIDPSRPHDQRRVATPTEALQAGADLIVVGRAVTEAPDPVAAAIAVAEMAGRTPPV
jgi:orotidine-5'-phosphate decarboxylase